MAKPKHDVQFGIHITKWDEAPNGGIYVHGVATGEVVDSHGEILPYEGSKKAFETWDGLVLKGHDPDEPSGRRVEVFFDDVKKEIAVKSLISGGAPNVVQLIKDDVLRDYSVGGTRKKSAKEVRDGKEVRVTPEWEMDELSVVARGAYPNARITLVKGAHFATDEELKAVALPDTQTEDRLLKAVKDAAAKAGADGGSGPSAGHLMKVLDGGVVMISGLDEKGRERLRKFYGWGSDLDDLSNMLYAAQSIQAAIRCEAAEGEADNPEIGFLRAALENVMKALGVEAAEFVTEQGAVAASAMRDKVTLKKLNSLEAGLSRLEKKAGTPAPATDAEAIAKALGTVIGEEGREVRKAITALNGLVAETSKVLAGELEALKRRAYPEGPAGLVDAAREQLSKKTSAATDDPVLKSLYSARKRCESPAAQAALDREIAARREELQAAAA